MTAMRAAITVMAVMSLTMLMIVMMAGITCHLNDIGFRCDERGHFEIPFSFRLAIGQAIIDSPSV